MLVINKSRKGLYSKRREFNKVILRAVSNIVLLSCRLIYIYENIHYLTCTIELYIKYIY